MGKAMEPGSVAALEATPVVPMRATKVTSQAEAVTEIETAKQSHIGRDESKTYFVRLFEQTGP
jgi:hypothetical protein